MRNAGESAQGADAEAPKAVAAEPVKEGGSAVKEGVSAPTEGVSASKEVASASKEVASAEAASATARAAGGEAPPRSAVPVFPSTADALVRQANGRSVRAGGTDLQERRHLGLARGPLIDLRDVAELDAIAVQGDFLKIGCRTRIAGIAADATVLQQWPGLAAAAGHLATPEIRNQATLGGNLLQSVRCWYYRRPGANCYQAGGDRCDARGGDHSLHACIDLGPCIAPHPSTLAVALLAHEAEIEVAGGERWPVAALYGDGSDPRRPHRLPAGAVLLAVYVPRGLTGERAAFHRTSSRARAEWPIAEAVVRVVVTDGAIRYARVAVGGVANIPLRLPAVEQRLLARPPTPALLAEAAELAGDGFKAPPGAAYKLPMLRATVLTALESAVGQESGR